MQINSTYTGRTIAEIKNQLTADFVNNNAVADAYNLPSDPAQRSFSRSFSKVSVESLLFYVVACCTWALERLFDQHRSEVEQRIDDTLPHRPKWYRDMAKKFMYNLAASDEYEHDPETDFYDTSNLSDDEIAEMQVVKHAASIENEDYSILLIKVAGGSGGIRQPLTTDQADKLLNYLNRIKDAGVRIRLINQQADLFNCRLKVWIDPLADETALRHTIEETITNYVQNLPFNGIYTNMELVDTLQVLDGVRIVEPVEVSAVDANQVSTSITSPYQPAAGYLAVNSLTLDLIPYNA